MNDNNIPESAAPQPVPLDVSAKVYPTKEDENLLTFANVTLGGCFAVKGIRIMDGEKGVFVAMPDKRDTKGEYRDICFPTTPEMRQAVHTAVLGEYQRVMEQFAAREEQTRPSVRDALQNAAKRPAPDRPKAPPQHKADRGAR